MISILQNSNMTEKKLDEIVEWYYAEIIKIVSKQNGAYKKRYDWLENFNKNLKLISFEELIKLKPDQLKNYSIVKVPENERKKLLDLYKIIRKKIGVELIKKLDITVCPYCNRNFVNNAGDRTTVQFDHFYDKANHPLLTISFYNLIPSCYICNSIRNGKKQIEFSPYMDKFTDDILTFKYYLKKSGYAIYIEPKDNIIAENLEVLQLEKLYSIHENLIKELELKQKMYPLKYIENMNLLMDKNFTMTSKEIYYGNFLSQENYFKRPLSKFTHDIICDLENN